MNTLDTIVAQKRREVALLPPGKVTVASLQKVLAALPARRDFFAALQAPDRGRLALIAEVKKASPSAGIICPDFDPVRIAREYEAAGASCLSVLTDGKFFHGSLDDLRRIRSAVKLPLLRKDFIIDERQILEAAEWGADAILLIVRILDDESLKHFHSLAAGAGLAALVEVHDEAELDRALAVGARLIGVNNRDLDTLTVDPGTTERLAARIARRAEAKDKLLVAESGIQTRADAARAERAGAGAILVGEALLKNPAGIAAKISELLTEIRHY
jgi:indole-3-glycerol phosphate synthase